MQIANSQVCGANSYQYLKIPEKFQESIQLKIHQPAGDIDIFYDYALIGPIALVINCTYSKTGPILYFSQSCN